MRGLLLGYGRLVFYEVPGCFFWQQGKSGYWVVEGEEWVKLQESFLARAFAGTFSPPFTSVSWLLLKS